MGIALAPSLPGGPAKRAAQGQAVVDASWVLAARDDGTFDRWVLFGSTVPQYVTWSLGTVVGVAAGGALPDAHDLGLDALYPAFFLALLLTEMRKPGGSDRARRRGRRPGAGARRAGRPPGARGVADGLPGCAGERGRRLDARRLVRADHRRDQGHRAGRARRALAAARVRSRDHADGTRAAGRAGVRLRPRRRRPLVRRRRHGGGRGRRPRALVGTTARPGTPRRTSAPARGCRPTRRSCPRRPDRGTGRPSRAGRSARPTTAPRRARNAPG